LTWKQEVVIIIYDTLTCNDDDDNNNNNNNNNNDFLPCLIGEMHTFQDVVLEILVQ
jgi:hypothetical protein